MSEVMQQRVAEELGRLRTEGKQLTVEIPAELVCILIGQLQLALRHPRNVSVNAQASRGFCEFLIANIADESQFLAAFLRQGFDPAHDVKAPEGG